MTVAPNEPEASAQKLPAWDDLPEQPEPTSGGADNGRVVAPDADPSMLTQGPHGRASRLNHALALAARGFRIFPLVPNRRTPAKEGWQEIATTDPATIKAWWRKRDYNIGVATGGGLVVIDYDMKPGQKGAEALRLHDSNLFVETFRVKTPNGVHVFYRTVADCFIANSVSRIAEHVDVRGEGGYVVGPGSVVDGKTYEIINDAPLAPLPEMLAEAARKTSHRKHDNANTPVVELDTADAIKRAIDYLEHDAPEAIEGAGGDDTTYRVACRVKDFGISEHQCFELLAEHWNDTKACPSWDQDDLRRKVANAYAYGTLPPGGLLSSQSEFPDLRLSSRPPDAWPDQANQTMSGLPKPSISPQTGSSVIV